MQSAYLQSLKNQIKLQRETLLNHPLYSHITQPEHIRCFMKHHAFAVWDFMSLVKYLQSSLTQTQWPWFPKSNPHLTRLINEIVLGEESDLHPKGGYTSHFELYIEAMKQCGAETEPILKFTSLFQNKRSLEASFEQANTPSGPKEFVSFTLQLLTLNKLHCTASVFTFGREDLIPDLFLKILDHFKQQDQKPFELFKYYLERHIEVDGEEHGQMALQLLETVCENSEEKWNEATDYANKALQARIRLWDFILYQIKKTN